MITNFKIFESISYPYKVDDYLLIKLRSRGVLYDDVICQIVEIENTDITVKMLDERFDDDMLLKKSNNRLLINNNYIKCWSENRDELEQIINANKYNL